MDQVCLGLQAAHERGVIHGHLKPGHVFVTDDRHVKLLDFGAGDGRPDAFASPEQVNGTRRVPTVGCVLGGRDLSFPAHRPGAIRVECRRRVGPAARHQRGRGARRP